MAGATLAGRVAFARGLRVGARSSFFTSAWAVRTEVPGFASIFRCTAQTRGSKSARGSMKIANASRSSAGSAGRTNGVELALDSTGERAVVGFTDWTYLASKKRAREGALRSADEVARVLRVVCTIDFHELMETHAAYAAWDFSGVRRPERQSAVISVASAKGVPVTGWQRAAASLLALTAGRSVGEQPALLQKCSQVPTAAVFSVMEEKQPSIRMQIPTRASANFSRRTASASSIAARRRLQFRLGCGSG